MCSPPPISLRSRIQIRSRQECFSTDYLFMWYIILEVHHSVLMAAGLREILLFGSFLIMYPIVIRQIAYTFYLNKVFCKPISCELSKMHVSKLLLNIIMSFPAHTALGSFNGYVQRVYQRLMYCFNGPIINELSMPKIWEQVFRKKLDRPDPGIVWNTAAWANRLWKYQIWGCSFWM